MQNRGISLNIFISFNTRVGRPFLSIVRVPALLSFSAAGLVLGLGGIVSVLVLLSSQRVASNSCETYTTAAT